MGIVDEYSNDFRSGCSKAPTLLTYIGAAKSGYMVGLFMQFFGVLQSDESRGAVVDVYGVLYDPVAEPHAN